MILLHDKLPPGVELSEDLRQKAFCYLSIQYLGRMYYLPVSRKMKKAFDIHIDNGILIQDYARQCLMEEILMDIIAAVYLQIRDTVGSEIQATLSSEIANSFQKLFGNQLALKIENDLNQRLLPGGPDAASR